MGHLKPIDGLRGYLAMWVALGHALSLAGYVSLPFGLTPILNAGYAVEVFIIISGFVITHLLLKGKESYGQYITRRFFRLYPIYVTCCVVGYFVLPSLTEIVHQVPWKESAAWVRYAGLVDELQFQTYDNTARQAIAHLTMLHGLLPKQILPRAAMTFLPAAWSISLEWQFYLLAPLVLAGLRSKRGGPLVIMAALACYILFTKGVLGDYYGIEDFHINASIFGASGYFAAGIASRFAYDPLKRLQLSPVLVALVSMYLIYVSVGISVSLTIWLTFFSYLLWHQCAPITGRIFQIWTAGKVPLLIGSMSYSIYLIHRPLQIIALRALMPHVAITHLSVLLIQLGALAATLPIAYALYRVIELPGQELGRRAAALWWKEKEPIALSRLSVGHRPEIETAASLAEASIREC